jgi:hypothetical protein
MELAVGTFDCEWRAIFRVPHADVSVRGNTLFPVYCCFWRSETGLSKVATVDDQIGPSRSRCSERSTWAAMRFESSPPPRNADIREASS